MKFLIILSVAVACAAAFPEEYSEHIRNKRGVIGIPTAVSYSSQVIHHTPSIPVAYHTPVVKYVAPIPTVKVIQPYPITKVLAPAVSYTKVAYPAPILPYYGYGFGHFHH